MKTKPVRKAKGIAYSYWRFSNPSQRFGDSARRQTDLIKESREWCMGNHFRLSEETFADEGKSAGKGRNLEPGIGDLARFVDLVSTGRIQRGSLLLLESYDRFSRLPITRSVQAFLGLVNNGIGIVFLNTFEKKVLDEKAINAEPYLMYSIVGEAQRAHAEIAIKGKRISEAMQQKIARAKNGEQVNLGSFVPNWLDWNGRGYELNKKAATVERVFNLYEHGNTLQGVAYKLNTEGTKPLGPAKEWTQTTVRKILGSRFVIGEYKGVANYFPAAIEEPRFDAVQLLVKRNARRKGTPSGMVNIFKGLIFCEQCGKPICLHTSNNGKQKVNYYRCCSPFRANGCDQRRLFPVHELELQFFALLMQQTASELIQAHNPKTMAQVTKLEAKKILIQTQRKRHEAMLKDPNIPLEDIRKELANLGRDLKAIELAIVEVKTKSNLSADVEKVHGQIGSLLSDNLLEFDKAAAKLEQELKSDPIRKELQRLLPSLIDSLIINLNEQTYRIKRHDGSLSESEQLYTPRTVFERVK